MSNQRQDRPINAGQAYVSQEKGLRMDNQYQSPQEYLELASDEQERLDKVRQILDAAQAKYSILINADTVHSADDGVVKGVGQLEQMAPTFLIQSENGWICAVISGQPAPPTTRIELPFLKRQSGVLRLCNSLTAAGKLWM